MSANVPKIEANQSFLSQTSDLSFTTIFTPSADGLFRVSTYATGTGAAGVIADIQWTDENGTGSPSTAPEATAGQPASQSVYIHATSGNPIQVKASIPGGTGFTYDLYVTVESL